MENNKTGAKKVGKYDLIAKIAQGGMGAVYKAKHPTLGRTVLLKKLALRGGTQFTERFKREARLMMDFKNDHIVQVYDHFKEGPYYYIVEEFVDGVSLDSLIRKERYLNNDAATLILYEVCKALKYAHDKQVIHRDIKPANILISKEGEVKLVDFGIATSLEETDDTLTREGMTLGTPAYIPPEQIDNAKAVDRRSDIYSLGVVIYEMLTGKTPFPGSFTAETINLIHKGRYVPLGRLNPKVSPLLLRIARKCMRVKRNRRFQDLSHVIRILERRIKRKDDASIKQAIKAVLAGKEMKDVFKRKRSWVSRVLAGVVLIAILGAAGFFLYLKGYYFELIAPDRYGAVVIAADVSSAYKEPDEVFFKPVLYRMNGTQMTRLDVDFGLAPVPGKPTDPRFEIASKKLYLEAGTYRLKISLEGQLYWESFTVQPRTVQKKTMATLDAQKIVVEQGAGAPQPLALRVETADAATGRAIQGADVTVWINDRLVPGGMAAADSFMTGATYKLTVSAQGYYPQTYTLLVKPYQRYLDLQAALVPHPGTLVIKSSTDNVTLQLNGSDSYSTGGLKPETKKLTPVGVETRRIALGAGDYTLTVRRLGKSQTLNVHVDPDQTLSVEVSFDKGTGTLYAAINN